MSIFSDLHPEYDSLFFGWYVKSQTSFNLDLSFDMGSREAVFETWPQDSNLMTAISEQLTFTAHELTLVDDESSCNGSDGMGCSIRWLKQKSRQPAQYPLLVWILVVSDQEKLDIFTTNMHFLGWFLDIACKKRVKVQQCKIQEHIRSIVQER